MSQHEPPDRPSHLRSLAILIAVLLLAAVLDWFQKTADRRAHPPPTPEGSRSEPSARPPLQYQINRVC
jgi:hypothetical protein